MISGEKFTDKPPYTNRGVQNTKNNDFTGKQYILFDWLEFTIFNKKHSPYEYFKYLFNIDQKDIVFESGGVSGYIYTYTYKNIRLYDSNNPDMGYHFIISGKGCRDLEEIGISYKSLFKILLSFNTQYSRIDVSIDDFTNDYFNLEKVKDCVLNGEVRSRFKNAIEFKKTSLLDSSDKGHTIWFGSRSSKLQIVFYDKLKERESQNVIVDSDIKYWNRVELRFRDEHANFVVSNYLDPESDIVFIEFIKGILYNYIQFVYKSETDSNKARWKIKTWWSDYLDNVSKIKLQNLYKESDIAVKKKWLSTSVSKTEFSVFISDLKDLSIDEVSSNFIYDQLMSGYKKITYKDIQYINEYRASRGLTVIDMKDIEDFIASVKEVLLIKN